MTDQLELLSDTPVDPTVRLTARQRLALEYIGHHQPVASDELGAFLHEDRRARGGKGHGADERCDYCQQEGAQMGAALRLKGLVKRKRGVGWVVSGTSGPNPERPGRSGQQDGDTVDWGGFGEVTS